MQAYNKMSHSQKHFSLHTLQSHGLWGKSNPFVAEKRALLDDEKIGIITRATLRPRRLLEFWRAVPAASKAIQNAKGIARPKIAPASEIAAATGNAAAASGAVAGAAVVAAAAAAVAVGTASGAGTGCSSGRPRGRGLAFSLELRE